MPHPDLKDLFHLFPDLPWARPARRPVAERVRIVREQAAVTRRQLRLSVDRLHSAAVRTRVGWVKQRSADANDLSARIERLRRLINALPTHTRTQRFTVEQLRRELLALTAFRRPRA